MRLRSLLYVPADNPRFIAKAHTRSADAVILDLEDAVLPANKTVARVGLAQAVGTAGQSGARVFVRINGDLETALEDAEAAQGAGAWGLYVSKANADKLQRLDVHLSRLERQGTDAPMSLVALIEDPGGVLNAPEMARQKRVIALTAGGEDIALSLGGEAAPDVVRLPKLLIHYAAKAAGLLSFGLLQTASDYGDLDALAASAEEARRHGFDGASCVHPSAVEILNRVFLPSAEQLAWAGRVLEAAAATKQGAFAIDGKMIDAPIISRARAIVMRANAK